MAITRAWALYRNSLGSIIPSLSCFFTSVAMNFLSSCGLRLDFTAIGLQSGVKFVKSDEYRTLAVASPHTLRGHQNGFQHKKVVLGYCHPKSPRMSFR